MGLILCLLASTFAVVAGSSGLFGPDTRLPGLGAALVLGLAGTAAARDGGRLRPWLELNAFPVGLGLIWTIPAKDDWGLREAVVALLILGWFLGALGRDRDRWDRLGLFGGPFREAMARLAMPTAWMVVIPLAAAPALGGSLSPKNTLVSVLTYPLYAWIQLAIFLAYFLPRAEPFVPSPRGRVLAAAVLFALAHWPNPAVVPGCFVAMLVWADTYQALPSLPAVAVSMGLAATVFTQVLPGTVTGGMRVGPSYVREKLRADRELERARQVAYLGSDAAWAEAGRDPGAWLDLAYRTVLQSPLPPADRPGWLALLARLGPGRTAQALVQSEDRRRADEPKGRKAPLPDFRRAHLDQASIERDDIVLLGWAAKLKPTVLPEVFVALVDDALVEASPGSLPRPDVAKALADPVLAGAGFALRLAGKATPGRAPRRIRIFAAFTDGFAIEVLYPPGYPWGPAPPSPGS